MSEENKITILQVNCIDTDGRKIGHDSINHMLRSLSNSLDNCGLKNFIVIPRYDSLGEITILNPNDVCLVNINDSITEFSLKSLIDTINIKLREMSDTEDGLS